MVLKNRNCWVFSLVLMMALAPAGQAAWQGKMDTVDGVPLVINPETPAEGDQITDLEELWRLGDEDEGIFFGVIDELLHDEEGNLYVLDGQLCEVMVFDPDGEFLMTMGGRGDGPGEFRNAADMFWAPGDNIGVVQAFPGKVVLLKKNGDPGPPFALPYRDGVGFQATSRGAGNEDRMILAGSAWSQDDGQQMQHTYLKAYDGEGTEVASFHEASAPTSFGNYEFIEEDFTDFQRRWAAAPDGRVAAALSFDEYKIHVWNSDGSLQRIISRPDYKHVARTDDELAMFQKLYDMFTRWNRGSTFKVSPNHQDIGQVLFREDGTLWVLSSRDRWRSGGGVFTSFDVYDTEGRYTKRVTLVANADPVEDGLFFQGDRAYVVTDLLSATMAQFGAGEEEEEDLTDTEPVTVIAYKIGE